MHSHFRLSPYIFISITTYSSSYKLHFVCITQIDTFQTNFSLTKISSKSSNPIVAFVLRGHFSIQSILHIDKFLPNHKKCSIGKIEIKLLWWFSSGYGHEIVVPVFRPFRCEHESTPTPSLDDECSTQTQLPFPYSQTNQGYTKRSWCLCAFLYRANRFIARLRDYNRKCRSASANFRWTNTSQRSVCNFVEIPHVRYKIEEDVSRRFGGWLRPWG